MLALIVAIASAFALTACGETNGDGGSNTGNNGNGDNTDNTTVVTPPRAAEIRIPTITTTQKSRQPKDLNIRYSLTMLMK